MKSLSAFFYKIGMFTANYKYRLRNIGVCAAIVIPCALQPLLVFGADGGDNKVNSGAVLFQGKEQGVVVVSSVFDCGNLVGKGCLKVNDGKANNIPSIADNGKGVTDTLPNPSRHDADDKKSDKAVSPPINVGERGYPRPHWIVFWLGGLLIAVLPGICAIKPNLI